MSVVIKLQYHDKHINESLVNLFVQVKCTKASGKHIKIEQKPILIKFDQFQHYWINAMKVKPCFLMCTTQTQDVYG